MVSFDNESEKNASACQLSLQEKNKGILNGLLDNLAETKGVWREQPLTAFAALGESGNPKELMVVGRAVNSWTNKWHADDIKDPDVRSRIVDEAFAATEWHDGHPMRWVTARWGLRDRYSTKKSSFWRVVRAVVNGLEIANVTDLAWPSSICWSNLYKVSPHAGGNPSRRLAAAQLHSCIDMLEGEISEWQPRRILFLTGLNWARPFVRSFGWDLKLHNDIGEIEAKGIASAGAQIVIAPHPQGRREVRLTKSIVEAFLQKGQ